jgi:KipI family sensor histidine kinase inhibitor
VVGRSDASVIRWRKSLRPQVGPTGRAQCLHDIVPRAAMTSPTAYPQIERLSESLLIVRIGAAIDAAANQAVHALVQRIVDARLPGVVDVAPAYASVAVRYSPQQWRSARIDAFAAISAALRPLLVDAAIMPGTQRSIGIPVCYGGVHGVDLESAAQACGLDTAGFIALHAGAEYRVAMLGFAPGFPYLLGLPRQLHLPRRAEPRLRVPAGSVAIGGAQTGIYPNELPGGWHLIGRTPLRLFDSAASTPCLLAPGDSVRFRIISVVEFDAWPSGVGA